MACKTFFQRRWMIRCGLFAFFTWFLFAAHLLKHQRLFAVEKGPSSSVSSHQQPRSHNTTSKMSEEDGFRKFASFSSAKQERIHNELRLRAGDPRTIVVSDCPENYIDSLNSCAKLNFDGLLGHLPKTSIIITFHSEETISSLLHTVHSIVQRTPKQLIEEIIIIDDHSQNDDFGQVLEIYLNTVLQNTRVNLHRNLENLGLIRSRLKGTRLSTGEVLVFMDSHSEVQTGWLEPLLFEIKKNRRSLVCSVIDWMEKTPDNRWTYKYGCTDWTVVFDWSMGFGWNFVPWDEKRPNITDAYKSKAIIGSYSAIDKQFFREIGEFDDGMELWGAENIDLSIRVWLFDGQVLLAPCSRAAHLEGNGTRSYRDGYDSVVKRNYKRIAEVWFDEYKDCFYHYFPELISVDVGDLSDRLKVKASAPHNFKWYLENIYPELGCPVKDAFAQGPVRNLDTGRCLFGDQYIGTSECEDDIHELKIYWSNKFHLRQPNYVLLLHESNEEAEPLVENVEYLTFYRNDGASKWIHWKDGPLMELESRLCLEAPSSDEPSLEAYVVLRPCNFLENARQTWRFQEYTDQYEDLLNNNVRSKKIYGKEQQVLLHEYHLYG